MNRAAARAAVLLAMGAAACSSTQTPEQTSAIRPAASVGAKTTAAISEADLRQRLYLVADDSMGGRPTGSIGHIKVTQYIADEMKRLGLKPGGDNGTYFQNVPFIKRAVTSATIGANGQTLKLWDDYVPIYPNFPLRKLDGAQVVYGGILQDTTTMLTREQANGKFVILVNRTPNPASRGTGPGTRLEGAVGVATIQAPTALQVFRNFFRDPGPSYTGAGPQPGDRGLPMAISAEAAAILFGSPVDTTIAVGTAGRTINGTVTFSEAPVTARNVVAILPGSDAVLRAEHVAIGAHSDHDPLQRPAVDHDSLKVFNAIARAKRLAVGHTLTPAERAEIKVNVDSLRRLRPARLDSIKNGADDDGSGTVGVIEIAEAMAGASVKPKRSVIFVWHVAEELGLYGAEYFTDHPTVPRESIVAQLNIDMIGRGAAGDELNGGADYLQLIGWRRLSNELGDIIDATNKQQKQPFKFDLTYDATGHPEQYYCRSDHERYARYGIPISFFTTGGHGDYHQVTDEPQYIDYTKLRNVTQLVHDIGIRVANLDHRVGVDGAKPDPKGQCKQ